MIRFEQVSKRYPGSAAALLNVDFTVEAGEFVVLCGHSGAGKSTLLKMIPVLERPNSGRILVGTQDIGQLRPGAIPFYRRGLGMLLQEQTLLFDRSVYDNVMLPLAITGYPPRDADRRVRAALEKVGLKGREASPPVSLSGGEQQRLAIARAIVNKPAILIADEPTAHLDAAYAGEIAGLFKMFSQAGVTVIVSTHDPNLFHRFAPRLLRLNHGQLVS